jgi:hypothetical protein
MSVSPESQELELTLGSSSRAPCRHSRPCPRCVLSPRKSTVCAGQVASRVRTTTSRPHRSCALSRAACRVSGRVRGGWALIGRLRRRAVPRSPGHRHTLTGYAEAAASRGREGSSSARAARPARGPSASPTATARLRRATGLSVRRTSSSYHSMICTRPRPAHLRATAPRNRRLLAGLERKTKPTRSSSSAHQMGCVPGEAEPGRRPRSGGIPASLRRQRRHVAARRTGLPRSHHQHRRWGLPRRWGPRHPARDAGT